MSELYPSAHPALTVQVPALAKAKAAQRRLYELEHTATEIQHKMSDILWDTRQSPRQTAFIGQPQQGLNESHQENEVQAPGAHLGGMSWQGGDEGALGLAHHGRLLLSSNNNKPVIANLAYGATQVELLRLCGGLSYLQTCLWQLWQSVRQLPVLDTCFDAYLCLGVSLCVCMCVYVCV